MQDAGKPFYTGPAERTSVYVHITALSHKKKERRAMGTVLLPNFGLLHFLFYEQSDKDIVIQIKNVKYDFGLT